MAGAHGAAQDECAAIKGRWFLYEADFVDAANYGTLLSIIEVVDVAPGDVWRVNER